MDTILSSLVSGGLSGVALAWLFRSWISERLQQSIRHEYSQKLENHKAELNARIQSIQHENQLHQLRTSMFFDHQRKAFASILAKIAEANRAWIDKHYDPDEGWSGPIPNDSYRSLWAIYYRHQLFLDGACLAAVGLILSYYQDSFPVDDGSGQLHPGRMREAYDAVEYLQPRLAELFQSRIGVTTSRQAEREIALLGAIRLLNRSPFREIGLPPDGVLKVTYRDEPGDAVLKAESHVEDLKAKLTQIMAHLKREDGDGGFYHETATKAARYLEMLSSDAAARLPSIAVNSCSS